MDAANLKSMIFMNKILAAVGVFAALTAQAKAADMAPRYTKAPPAVEAAVNWSGFYFGVNGGWEQTHTNWTQFATGSSPFSLTNDGGTAGGQVGVLGQWGSFVAGAEVSYNGLFSSNSLAVSPNFLGSLGESKIRDLLLVTGKVGWSWDHNLFYAKGGYANADVKLNQYIGPPGFPTPTLSGTTGGREGGWTVGAGWEYMFAKNWSAGVEYDYARLNIGDRVVTSAPGFGCPAAVCGTRNANAEINMITARLNYHFNWVAPVTAKY
jgi:outer membrane immunogenic protein